MKKPFKRLFFVILLLLLTPHAFAFNGVCELIFSEPMTIDKLFSKIEHLEIEYDQLLQDASVVYGKLESTAHQNSLNQLVVQIQSNQKRVDVAINKAVEHGPNQAGVKEVLILESNQRLISERLKTLTQPKQKVLEEYDWNNFVENPSRLKENKLYEVETTANSTITVVFSNRVLLELFHSNQPMDQTASKKILKSMNRFVSGSNHKSSGLVELNASDKGVYEVRIHGRHAVGAIRLVGVKHNGVYHFVHVDRHSSHNATYGKHLIHNALSKFESDFN